jgi:formamidopyrimidine-DNA glycosylase
MPELPEVEVIRLFLEDKLLGLTIKKLEVFNPKSFIGNPKQIINKKIIGFSRVGKQLSIFLDNGLVLLVHLKMTGQLIYSPLSSKGVPAERGILGHPTKDVFGNFPIKSTRLIFTFSNNSKLYFNDQRKFGWIKILTRNELVESQKNLGLDIFNPEFTPQYLYSQLQRSSCPVKLVLLDQHFMSGIGNIYANDALFLAKIHPQTPASSISRSKVLKLYSSLLSIMHQSVLSGGSTARDQIYLRPDGSVGKNQFSFQVYQRSGLPCLVCKTPIKCLKLAGRGTFYCPHCQVL